MKKDQLLGVIAICMSILALYISVSKNLPATTNENASQEEIEMSGLEGKISALSDSLTNLEKSYYALSFDFYSSQNKSAYFSPTDNGFQLLETVYGNLTVSLENAEKFGDGYKLIFNFGNPTSMTILGLKGKITWRPRIDYKKYYSDVSYKNDMDAKTHSKDFEILTDLYPGAWNETPISIGPATEEEIGEISITDIMAPKVSMRTIHAPR